MKKHILLLGIGGAGMEAVQSVMKKSREEIFPVAFDMDETALQESTIPNKIDLSSSDCLNTVLKKIGYQESPWKFLGEYSGARLEYAGTGKMNAGSGAWRAKAMLAFVAFCADPENKKQLEGTIDRFFDGSEEGDSFELVAAASLAGGTGSGLLLPLVLYIKRYVKETYHINILSKAVLICPEVHARSMPDQRRIVAEANAYATMRELNAMHLAANGAFEKEAKTSSFRFFIGDDADENIGLLFDSHDVRFMNQEAMPFQRIYLFERTHFANSVPVQTELFSNTLSTICSLEDGVVVPPKNENPPIFSAISTFEVVIRPEKPANYIVNKKLFDDAAASWTLIPDATEALQQKKIESARLFGQRLSFTDADYSAMVTSVAEGLLPEFDEKIAQKALEDGSDDTASVSFVARANVEDVIADADTAVQELIFGEAEEAASEIINRPIFPPRKKGEAKLKKEERKQKFLDAVRSYAECLDTIYPSVRETKISPRESELIESIVNRLLTFEGAFVRPDIALVRLSRFHQNLWATLKSETEPVFYEQMPFYLDHPEPSNTPYGRQESERFALLTESSETRETKKFFASAEESFDLVQRDAHALFSKMVAAKRRNVRKHLLARIEALIVAYRETFLAANRWMTSLKSEAAELLHAADHPAAAYTDLFEKNDYIELYAAYERAFPSSELFDALYGETFAELRNAASAADVLAGLRENLTRQLTESAFYADSLGCGAVAVLRRKTQKDPAFPTRAFTRALHKSGPALSYTLPETTKLCMYPKKSRTVVFPEETRLTEEEIGIFGLGEAALLCNGASQNNILMTGEVGNLTLDSINQFSESSPDAACYRSYRKSLELMRRYFTVMWHPHILGGLRFCESLPFISRTLQATRSNLPAKAFLYALLDDALDLQTIETGERVLCLRNEAGLLQRLEINGSYIASGDWVAFLAWLHRNEETAAELAAKYDQLKKEGLSSLPACSFGNSDFTPLVAAIARAKMIRRLKNDLFAKGAPYADAESNLGIVEFAYKLHLEEEARGGYGDAELLLAEANDALLAFCGHSIPAGSTEVLSGLFGIQAKEFCEVLDRDPKIADWINSCNVFLALPLKK